MDFVMTRSLYTGQKHHVWKDEAKQGWVAMQIVKNIWAIGYCPLLRKRTDDVGMILPESYGGIEGIIVTDIINSENPLDEIKQDPVAFFTAHGKDKAPFVKPPKAKRISTVARISPQQAVVKFDKTVVEVKILEGTVYVRKDMDKMDLTPTTIKADQITTPVLTQLAAVVE